MVEGEAANYLFFFLVLAALRADDLRAAFLFDSDLLRSLCVSCKHLIG